MASMAKWRGCVYHHLKGKNAAWRRWAGGMKMTSKRVIAAARVAMASINGISAYVNNDVKVWQHVWRHAPYVLVRANVTCVAIERKYQAACSGSSESAK